MVECNGAFFIKHLPSRVVHISGPPFGFLEPLQPNSLFEDGPGPGLEPVGGEFQPSFETAHPGGDAYLFTVLHSIFALKHYPLFCHSCYGQSVLFSKSWIRSVVNGWDER